MAGARKKKLAVWKFASCDGCQLSLLDCEDELLRSPTRSRSRHFLEASSGVVAGPYDLSLVEELDPDAEDAEIQRSPPRIAGWSRSAPARPRAASRRSATSPTFGIHVRRPRRRSTVDARETSTPISAHVPGRLRAARVPVNKHQLLEVLSAYLNERRPASPPTASASSASGAATSASWSPTGRPA